MAKELNEWVKNVIVLIVTFFLGIGTSQVITVTEGVNATTETPLEVTISGQEGIYVCPWGDRGLDPYLVCLSDTGEETYLGEILITPGINNYEVN